MADALCGPSNPLQQFKQQTQFDRTLQQDRLTSRSSPSQGFRSVDPNAGLLDPEFEAFQAGLPPSELPHFHQTPPSLSGPSQAPSWANDFQRMHISAPQPFHQAQNFSAPPPAATNNWAQGFQQHIAQTAPRPQSSAPSPQAFQYMARYGMNGYQNSMPMPATTSSFQSKGKAVATQPFDDAAFERAFDQAREAMLADDLPPEAAAVQEELAYTNGASTGDLDRDERTSLNRLQDDKTQSMLQERQNEMRMEHALGESLDLDQAVASSISSEITGRTADPLDLDEVMEAVHEPTVDEHNEQMQDSVQHDDDALAITAQELLEKVEHNQTDKFRNSQFLGLMRKLRDREVKVEGDKMVETASASTDTAPSQVRFNNSEQTPQPLQNTQPPIDVAPLDYQSIPPHEQDHDLGRNIDPNDGRDVVDLLNQPDLPENNDMPTHDIGTSASPMASNYFPEGVYYGDLRQRGWSEMKTDRDGALPQQPTDRPFTADEWKQWVVHGTY